MAEFRKNDVVQFNERHKWCGSLGIITKITETDNTHMYMIGVPIPQQGIAYIRVLDSEDAIEYIGHAVLTESEDED